MYTPWKLTYPLNLDGWKMKSHFLEWYLFTRHVNFRGYIYSYYPSLPNTLWVSVWTPKHLLRTLFFRGSKHLQTQGIWRIFWKTREIWELPEWFCPQAWELLAGRCRWRGTQQWQQWNPGGFFCCDSLRYLKISIPMDPITLSDDDWGV